MELKEISKKIILLGDSKTGKTAIVERYVHNRFIEEYTPGTGVKLYSKTMQFIYPNLIVNLKFTIYDLAGQREYSRIREPVYSDADAVLIVCDLSRPETVTAVPDFWLMEIKNFSGKLAFTYLGNKIDLVDEESAPAKLLQKIADRNGVPIFFCSANTGENIEEAFQFIGKQLISGVLHTVNKPSKHRPTDLKSAFDYIIADFCAQHGDIEKAMSIAQNQFLEAGLDIRHLTKEALLDVIERLKMIEVVLLNDTIANGNFEERRSLIESLKKP